MELPTAEELAALSATPMQLSVALDHAADSVEKAEVELHAAAAAAASARRRNRAVLQLALQRAKHKRDSEVEAAEVAARHLVDPQLLWQTAETAMLEEQWSTAVAGFLRAARVSAGSREQARCYNAAGVCLLLAVRLEEAIRMINLAIKTDPCEARAWHNRSQAHFMRRNFAAAVEDVTEALALDPTSPSSAALLDRVRRHRDILAREPLPTATPAEVGETWSRGHAAWARDIRDMLSSLVPSPDTEQGGAEPTTQIALPTPSGASLAAAAMATATERRRAEQGIGETDFLAHRCSRATTSSSELQARLDQVERSQLEQLDEMGLDLRTQGGKVTLVAVPQFSSLENDIEMGAPRTADDEPDSLACKSDDEQNVNAPDPATAGSLHADLRLPTTQNPTPTMTMVVGSNGIVNGHWDHSSRAHDWRQTQDLAAEVSALEATHSRLAEEVAVEADQLGIKPPITEWRQRFDTDWQRALFCLNYSQSVYSENSDCFLGLVQLYSVYTSLFFTCPPTFIEHGV